MVKLRRCDRPRYTVLQRRPPAVRPLPARRSAAIRPPVARPGFATRGAPFSPAAIAPGKDNSALAEDVHNKNPSLALSGKSSFPCTRNAHLLRRDCSTSRTPKMFFAVIKEIFCLIFLCIEYKNILLGFSNFNFLRNI